MHPTERGGPAPGPSPATRAPTDVERHILNKRNHYLTPGWFTDAAHFSFKPEKDTLPGAWYGSTFNS